MCLVANIIDVWPVSTIIEEDISAYNGSYEDRGAIDVRIWIFLVANIDKCPNMDN